MSDRSESLHCCSETIRSQSAHPAEKVGNVRPYRLTSKRAGLCRRVCASRVCTNVQCFGVCVTKFTSGSGEFCRAEVGNAIFPLIRAQRAALAREIAQWLPGSPVAACRHRSYKRRVYFRRGIPPTRRGSLRKLPHGAFPGRAAVITDVLFQPSNQALQDAASGLAIRVDGTRQLHHGFEERHDERSNN